MTPLTILIPAAGSASRMRGGDKLLEDVHGHPMLHHQAALAVGLGLPTIVTLRIGDTARAATLFGLPLRMIEVSDAATGMSASLRAAAGAVQTALMILPADMPDLTGADLMTLITAFDEAPHLIHRGSTAQGKPGHPVILPASYLPAISQLSGDEGARTIVAHAPVRLVPLPDDHALTDLDTPEEWQRWRSTQGTGPAS